MAKQKKAPELTFQQHIADFLVREHKYGVLEQSDITDTEHFIAEDQLWAFLKATQADTLKKLADDYGTDARDEVFRALRKELEHTPLWMLLRHGLKVRGLEFRLYYPKPRSAESAAAKKYGENRITFRPHFYFGETNQEIDFVFFLNGLPIVALELKHEKNQNVHDAVAQFAARDHARKIFQHPFLYLAADTSDVMAATDPRREENFRWHNTGLTNTPQTPDEYPVEFLYREVLSKEQLLEALSFFLVRVPKREAEDDKPERPAFTIFPRYHQSRMVRKVADDIIGALRRDRRHRPQVSRQPFGRQRQDAVHLLAGRPAAQPVQARHEREAGGHRLHPHRPQVARHEYPGGHREVHAPEGRGGPGAEGRRPAAFPEGAQADHRHHPAEVRLGAGGDREEPGTEETARGLPDRRGPPLAGRPDGRGHPPAVPQGGRTRRRGRPSRTRRSRSPRSSASTTSISCSSPSPPRPRRPP